ncbi:uncharacterized protein [Euphorbia lathyris]|uniref:uncharacterized protein isoform X2 n=1 Tax=Euphorbia lathyris TaxID=212925 RepID=UPI003313C95A
MDPVKVNYPVDVAAPKLMGSEGFCRDRVTVMEMEVEGKSCESNRELCNSLLNEKDVTNSTNPSESTSLNKIPCPELRRHTSHPPCFPGEDVSRHVRLGGANGPSWIPKHEELQVQRKAGQVSRSGCGSAKRPRIILLEDTSGLAVDDTREPSDKLGPHSTKCDSNEKTQVAKQKNNLGSKRGDRRSIKVSAKTKYDSFSLKASLASFSSAAAGNNFFGSYGLKTDVHDITKLVDDISLNDLLQGTYECPKLGKDKGKKVASASEGFTHLVRKACSLIQLPKSSQFQSFSEMDSSSIEKLPACQSSISIVENGDSSTTDIPSPNKDSCSKLETPANFLDLSFDQPKYTLERLALPPPKDLESLLLDAAKPAVSSRSAPDSRPGKQISRRPSLPTFPWSHTFSGHCRTNSDAGKLLTSRTACQGRWMKIRTNFSSFGTASDCLPNLESFSYDESLVPSCGKKKADIGNNVASSLFVAQCERGSSSAAASVVSHASLGKSEGDLKNIGIVEHCPKLLAAAQTLCDIATCTSRVNKDGMMKWPKRPSQKAMKARKSKSTEKHEEIISPSTSSLGSDHFVRNGFGHTSKRPKLSTTEQKKDLLHINGMRKGHVSWSATPKSSRSSPNKSVRDSSINNLKQSCMMPPPAKVLNKNCNGQHKVHKLMRMDWSRESDRRD